MCMIVLYNDKEIETPQELIDILEIPIESLAIPDYYEGKLKLDSCLCQVDLRKTLSESGFKFSVSEDTFDYEILGRETLDRKSF